MSACTWDSSNIRCHAPVQCQVHARRQGRSRTEGCSVLIADAPFAPTGASSSPPAGIVRWSGSVLQGIFHPAAFFFARCRNHVITAKAGYVMPLFKFLGSARIALTDKGGVAAQ